MSGHIGRPKKIHDPRVVKGSVEGYEADAALAAKISISVALRHGLKDLLPDRTPQEVYEILIHGEEKAIADHRRAIGQHEDEIDLHNSHLEEYKAKLARVSR